METPDSNDYIGKVYKGVPIRLTPNCIVDWDGVAPVIGGINECTSIFKLECDHDSTDEDHYFYAENRVL